MNKEVIFEKLKSIHKSLRKPSNIDFESLNGTLYVTMTEKGVTANMQNNESAFEGWAIAIKAALPDVATRVVVRWKTPSSKKTHYIRFLYRIRCFVMSYEWASFECLDNTAKNDYETVCKELKEWVTNFPSKEASKEAAHEEAQLERALNDVLPGVHDHQLPVGLFYKEVSKRAEHERTPRGGSQIDLWSITDETFTVYELKKDDNRLVGIVSELMFYVNVIKDLADGVISFGKGAENIDIRNYKEVYKNINEKKIKKVVGVFLANYLHPILTLNRKEFFSILNENKRKIEYRQDVFNFGIIKITNIIE